MSALTRALVLVSIVSIRAARGDVVDIEVPAMIEERSSSETVTSRDESIDLANIVQSAAKGITTAQEAPAIVTVVTSEEIRDRQLLRLSDLYESVPGWTLNGVYHSAWELPVVRGQIQAVQYLHDGLSLFDPMLNVPGASRTIPMELVKRVELITGPGGVLWGSNSFLGIINVITKSADDLEGVEVGGRLGDGRGDRLAGRAYAMAGTSLLGGRLRVLAHGSVDTYQGAIHRMPQLLFHGPNPQPDVANIYGPLVSTEQEQSAVVSLFTKVQAGDFQLRIHAPFGEQYNPAGLSGNPVLATLPDDKRCPPGVSDPTCADPLRRGRTNALGSFDRYAVVEYRNATGLSARGYISQFVRTFAPEQVIASAPGGLQGGVAFSADATTYRTGTAVDGSFEVGTKLRVLYGGEAFYEWLPDNVERSRQGAGVETTFSTPYQVSVLPFACPRIFDPAMMASVTLTGCPITLAFAGDRTVFGAYVSPQYRISKNLLFDFGGRIQVAPASLGVLSYEARPTVSTALVWGFLPNWHLKLNYTQGFRPPVFNNALGNGQAIGVNGDPNLTVETSDAAQVEINARLWKGDRRIRELVFRADASYTRISNLIQIIGAQYENSGDRGISSGELLGKLYVQGGHQLELAYTYLRVDASDRGRLRTHPANWLDFSTVFSVVPERLTATTRLRLSGAFEDPNRIVEYRGVAFDPMTGDAGEVSVPVSAIVLDRIPAQAELSVGSTYTPTKGVSVQLTVANVLGSHGYYADPFADFEPHFEYMPNPKPGFRAYLSAMLHY